MASVRKNQLINFNLGINCSGIGYLDEPKIEYYINDKLIKSRVAESPDSVAKIEKILDALK